MQPVKPVLPVGPAASSIPPGRGPGIAAAVGFPLMAGAMGWGIRGQYGHETGAMMAGLLVGLVLVRLYGCEWRSLGAARTAALLALGISVGGSMTYGQTIGLTQDAPLIGNGSALAWGMIGLFVKGAIWIGFGGLFLGMCLGGRAYPGREWLLLLAGMIVLWWVGTWALNEPFDPAGRILPRIYFSDDWRWEPGAELAPRRERWGGLLCALLGSIAYVRWGRADRLAFRLALWAMLGGGLGFSGGQCFQAFHAWNGELFRHGWLGGLEPIVNWWNLMETTFGAVWGAVLGLGLWLNRSRVVPPQTRIYWPPWAEGVGLGVHLALLSAWSFLSVAALDRIADVALTMIVLPVAAVVGGRYWPYWVVFPVTLIPIAGRTVEVATTVSRPWSLWWGLGIFLVLPLVTMTGAAAWHARRQDVETGAGFSRSALGVTAGWYFLLNFAVFEFPWPWSAWTIRTLHALVYLVCAVGITVGMRWAERARRQ